MIPIVVGHTTNLASRVGKGLDKESLGCQHDFLFYACDQQLEGTIPFSVGEAGEGGGWRHIIVEGINAEHRGWKHNFTFYAYKNKRTGTIPYAVGHAENESGGWKYRIQENVKSVYDYKWASEFSMDFIFYAFLVNPEDLIPISITCLPNQEIANVSIGLLRESQLNQGFTFNALRCQYSDSVAYSVDSEGDGKEKRYRICEALCGEFGYADGWRNQEVIFFAFKEQRPGTVAFSIGHTAYSGGWKYRIKNMSSGSNDAGWDDDGVFYAYPFNMSLLMRVDVFTEDQYGCTRVKRANCVEEFYFSSAFSFYGFRSQYAGTIPIYVSEAGANHNHTLRSCVQTSTDASNRGWTYLFTVFVFPDRRPGTIPIAVGHADFELGGWKYRLADDSENAGTQSWIHDFIFYAYPHRN